MSVQPPGRGWNVLGAMFLIVAGLLLVVIGGVCSYFMGGAVISEGGTQGTPLLLISLGTLGAGCALIYKAIKLLRD
ncbi:MAG: hypothetical protein ABIR87_05025 [Sphingomicrobium sp.]